MAHTRESTLVLFGAIARARACAGSVALARMRPPRARVLGRRAPAAGGAPPPAVLEVLRMPLMLLSRLPPPSALPMPRQTWTAR